jgi:hypothetical protein
MPRANGTHAPLRKQYTSLEPRVKTLNESTIRKRWKKLPVGTQIRIADLIRTAGRSTITRGGKDKKSVQTQSVVNGLFEEYVEVFVVVNRFKHTNR